MTNKPTRGRGRPKKDQLQKSIRITQAAFDAARKLKPHWMIANPKEEDTDVNYLSEVILKGVEAFANINFSKSKPE